MRGHPRNTKGASVNNKIGLRDKCWLSPQQAARRRAFREHTAMLVQRAALAWAGAAGVGLSAWVAVWHILVRSPARPDLFLGACAAIFLASTWMCAVGCHARYLLEHHPRRQ